MSQTHAVAAESCDPQQAAEFLRALAHPMRLRILCRLLEGELAVSGFETELGLRQPNLSQQLSQLREAALVTTRREAKSIFYSLADERVRLVLDALRAAFGTIPTTEAASRAKSRARAEAPALAEPSMRPVPQQTAGAPPQSSLHAAAECGVFSIAGWTPASAGRRSYHG
jgi:ArsR family transcriptional regulator